METESCWDRGCASLLSAAHVIPYACPCFFGADQRYELVELEALTARSWIYRAKDHRFSFDGGSPQVAIKVSRLEGQPVEAYLGRKVEHEGVVRLLDHGRTDGGHSFVVMEWVDGGDLGSGEVPWSPREAAKFVAKLARIVQAAHGVFVIHCDLKPSNILLTRDREPRLADFDLAQRAGDDSCVRKGTLAYMAPEQYRGLRGAHGVQADVYALGGVLHYLVAGAAPHGDEPERIKERLLKGAVPGCDRVEPALAGIVKRALSPDLAVRYETTHALAVDLERWLAHRPLDWQTPSRLLRARLWAKRHPAAAVALAATVIGGFGAAAARGEWMRRERAREAQVAVKVEEKYDSLKGALRSIVGRAGKTLAAERRNEMNNEQLLASMTVMQWLDFEQPGGKLPEQGSLHDYGVQTWTEVLRRCQSRNGDDDLLALFAHVNLARLAITNGDFVAADRHVSAAESRWADRLRPGESTQLALRVMRAIVTARLSPDSSAAPDMGALKALENEAKEAGIGESLLRQLRSAASRR